MRSTRVVTVLALLGLAVRQGMAQNNHVIRFDPRDSVLAIRPARSADVNLVVDVDCQGVSSYDITLFLDAARVQLTGATAIAGTNVPAPTITTFTDSTRIVSSGGTGFVTCGPRAFVDLTFALSGGATEGSLISMHVNQMMDGLSQDMTPFTVTGLLDVCQALHTWGDVDDDGPITSRDALIALTAAVGLPTPGFDLAPGDVDSDGHVTARDALLILSDAIGLGDGGARTGEGIAHQCAPLAMTPNDLLYWAGDGSTLNRVLAGDSTPTALALPLVGNINYSARFSSTGGMIAYVCGVSSNSICTVDGNGASLHQLAVGNQNTCGGELQPVWSPASDSIAFVDNNCGTTTLWVVDSAGSTTGTQILTGYTVLELGGWSSGGLVFSGYSVCCARRLWVVAPDGSSVHELFTNSSFENPGDPAWSPAADSVAFTQIGLSNGDGSLTVVSATSLQQGVRSGQLMGLAETPSWLAAGLAFRAPVGNTNDVVLQTLSGRYLRLTRAPNPGGATRPSFR